MSSSNQTDCSQQLQHQRLCPDAIKGLGLVSVRQTKDQYSIQTLKNDISLSFYLKKKKKINQISQNVKSD